MATVRNPQASEASSLRLPQVWVTPLKHSYEDGMLRTVIAGQSKTGAVCSGPILHNKFSVPQQQLFDACSMSNDLGVYIGDQSSSESCLLALQAHVQSLQAAAPANASQTALLPLELQVPPLLSPWPPNNTITWSCSNSSAVSARGGKQCISCDGGTLSSTADGAPLRSMQ